MKMWMGVGGILHSTEGEVEGRPGEIIVVKEIEYRWEFVHWDPTAKGIYPPRWCWVPQPRTSVDTPHGGRSILPADARWPERWAPDPFGVAGQRWWTGSGWSGWAIPWDDPKTQVLQWTYPSAEQPRPIWAKWHPPPPVRDAAPPQWHVDPFGMAAQRWWDGVAWTAAVVLWSDGAPKATRQWRRQRPEWAKVTLSGPCVVPREGLYPDPYGDAHTRWWNGVAWTALVHMTADQLGPPIIQSPTEDQPPPLRWPFLANAAPESALPGEGYFRDPYGNVPLRWWNGIAWTGWVAETTRQPRTETNQWAKGKPEWALNILVGPPWLERGMEAPGL